MELVFAFLSKAAELSQDGTIDVFGAGFDTVQVPQLPTVTTPVALVAKFRCEPDEKGEVHEIDVDLSGPYGRSAHLATQRIVVGEGADNSNRSLGATLVAAVDAPFEAAGEHLFQVSLDGAQIACLPIKVLVGDAGNELPRAASLRAQWMLELGMSEQEITSLCDPENYPATTDEEAANINALRRMRSSKWSA